MAEGKRMGYILTKAGHVVGDSPPGSAVCIG